MNENNQLVFDPSQVDELIKQQIEYYDSFVAVKDSEVEGETPAHLFTQSPEELLAMAQASGDPVSFLEEIELPQVLQANTVDNIEDQATLDSILSTLSQNPDFDGNLEAVHGMVGELIAQVQGGLIDPDSAQEQLVFNILELFDNEGGI
ncbi:hypothetical protein [Vibrio owensii]|uniref:hypothetical protein n=1 Tax=Vibrio owensii TaxID=696485 RepID=UPI004068851E